MTEDSRGAAAMRGLQRELLLFQQELVAGGDHSWRLDPVELKSSVAC